MPLNSPQPFDSIGRLAKRFGDKLLVGAGTVMNEEAVTGVRDVGGSLIVTPHADVKVTAYAKAQRMFAVPGFFTPTEAFALLAAGADALKLFPAEAVAPAVLSAMRAVFPPDTAVLAVGGVNTATIAPWRAAGAAGFGVGSSIYKPGISPADVRVKRRRWSRRSRRLIAADDRSDNMNLNLAGKTALVTAASGGIGSGVAEALADAGVRVAISGRTRASLEMVADTLASRAGGRPAIVVGDVGAKSGPTQIAAAAAAALGGRIDILVNNAGASRPITKEADDSYWEESLVLNFMAARRLTDLVIPAMKAERWGRIISISGALVAPSSMPPPPPRRHWRAGHGRWRPRSARTGSRSTRSRPGASLRQDHEVASD